MIDQEKISSFAYNFKVNSLSNGKVRVQSFFIDWPDLLVSSDLCMSVFVHGGGSGLRD
jgi:hypothetical protein